MVTQKERPGCLFIGGQGGVGVDKRDHDAIPAGLHELDGGVVATEVHGGGGMLKKVGKVGDVVQKPDRR